MKTVSYSLFAFASTTVACLQDNCFRNFANNCASASAFCATFTTATTTALTATPTYFRPECTPTSRLSSACSCVFPKTVGPTETGTACVPCPPGRQYVKNGDFNDPDTSFPFPRYWDTFATGLGFRVGGGCRSSNTNDCFV